MKKSYLIHAIYVGVALVVSEFLMEKEEGNLLVRVVILIGVTAGLWGLEKLVRFLLQDRD